MVTLRKIAALAAKDLRHIWPHLLVMLPLLALFTTSDVPTLIRVKPVNVATELAILCLATVLALFSVVAEVVHTEPLVGDRQYWLTRPFTWYHLAVSKGIVILLCINLPLFVLQAGVLWANQISPTAHVADLLWRQVFFSAFLLLPAAALAAVTRSIGQFVLALLLAAIPFAAVAWICWKNPFLDSTDWIMISAMAAILIAGSIAVLVLQYARRRTGIARVMFAGMVLALIPMVLFQWDSVFLPSSPSPGIRFSLDRGTARPAAGFSASRPVIIELRLNAEGMPPESELMMNYARIHLESADAPGVPAAHYAAHHWSRTGGFLDFLLTYDQFARLSSANATLKGSLYLTLMNDAEIIPAPQGRDMVAVRGFGVCFPGRKLCVSPQPHADISILPASETLPSNEPARIVPPWDTYAPIPTSLSFYPLYTYLYELHGPLLVERPTSRFEYKFEFGGVQLADYARQE